MTTILKFTLNTLTFGIENSWKFQNNKYFWKYLNYLIGAMNFDKITHIQD